jgi:hypothetical protein
MFRTKEDLEDHRTRDDTSASLLSTRTHTQPEEEDLTDEGAEAEKRSGREGKRRVHQCYLAYDPDEARVKGEGEDQRACNHSL